MKLKNYEYRLEIALMDIEGEREFTCASSHTLQGVPEGDEELLKDHVSKTVDFFTSLAANEKLLEVAFNAVSSYQFAKNYGKMAAFIPNHIYKEIKES